jgi:hypothetical protein
MESIEICLRGSPLDFADPKLPARDKWNGSYSACKVSTAAQLRRAADYIEIAYMNFLMGRRWRR